MSQNKIHYKNLFYEIAPQGSKSRQLASKLFRSYKNPADAYYILTALSEAQREKLFDYIDKPYIDEHVKDFVAFYMLHRVTIPNNPRLKNIYWTNNLSLLYSDNTKLRTPRLKSIRKTSYQYNEVTYLQKMKRLAKIKMTQIFAKQNKEKTN